MPAGKGPKGEATRHTAYFYQDESRFSTGVKALVNRELDYLEPS